MQAVGFLAASVLRLGPPYEILLGPEGGFTPGERAAILDAGFQPARLGDWVLRADTAAVAAAAILAGAAAQRRTCAGGGGVPRDSGERDPGPRR